MKIYKSPSIVSYRGKDILEISGPCQAQSAFLNVGGGRQAMLGPEKVEYRQYGISTEIRLAKAGIKTINRATV